jgi:tRNA (Thr-GGU) A37 N-methylase
MDNKIQFLSHPRNNPQLPLTGIFATRKKDRPNHIGHTIVNLIKREKRKLFVEKLDAINGTPILDIKPVLKEFLPSGEIKEPFWTKEVMKNYWKK